MVQIPRTADDKAKEARDAERENDIATRDWWMVRLTGILTAATVVLAGFTYLLWRSTSKAVADSAAGVAVANRSAGAAEELAKSAMAAERAYVFFHDAVMDEEEDSDIADESYRVWWMNHGKTHATVTSLRFGCVAASEPPLPSTAEKRVVPFGMVIGGGRKWRRGGGLVPPIIRPAETVYLFGEISYRDIHGKSRKTWFCRERVGSQFVLFDNPDRKLNGYT